jgi:GT2 family glycosyltransferase
MTDLAIIIVSYKTRELLDKCLASIYAGKYPFSFEVVVVDNASGDGTPDMVASRHPAAVMIACDTNGGFSVGNNIALKRTVSRHVLLLNPDTEVVPESIIAMVRFLDSHPHVGIAGCQLLNTDMTQQESWFNFPIPFSRFFEKWKNYNRLAHFMLGFRDPHPEITGNGARRVDVVKGACLMIRRRTVEEIGLLDENSFLYADDIDWCIRARRAGWEAYILTGHNVVHHGWASTDQEPYITITSSRRSALYLYKKHYSFFFYSIWWWMIFQEVLYKWILNRIRLKTRSGDGQSVERYRAYRDLAHEMLGFGKAGRGGR